MNFTIKHIIKKYNQYLDYISLFKGIIYLQSPKVDDKVWIKLGEFNLYALLLLKLSRVGDIRDSIFVLIRRIRLHMKRSGFDFKYMKESYRLVILNLAGTPELHWTGKGPIVKRDKSGLPVFIPRNLRSIISGEKSRESQKRIQVILSVLSIFRVFPTKPKVDLESIISPFSGVTTTLPYLQQALKELLNGYIPVLKPHKLIQLNSTSPENKNSSWFSGFDVLAFYHNPKQL